MPKGDFTVRVLFVSHYDAIRGPMAEAFALAYGDEGMDFFSAGLVPGGFVRPQAMTVMGEVGLGVSWEHPRYLLPEHLVGVDYLVTIDCEVDERRLKYFQGKTIRWKVEDPLNKGLDVNFYRRTRDQIEALVKELVEALRSGAVEEMVEKPKEEAEAS
ncbi:MAG: low molecular weight phosphatase family protein [Thermoplasmata archaeon]